MNGKELKSWREKWQLTQEALAKLLGVHRVTVAKWESATRVIPPLLPLALKTLENQLEKKQTQIPVLNCENFTLQNKERLKSED